MDPLNRRILLIDDTESIHKDYRRVLRRNEAPAGLAQAEAALFGETPAPSDEPEYTIDSAYQGADGVERVRAARQSGAQYAVAFVDMRMPPGMDGLETVRRLWAEDPDVQVVVATAFSDHSSEELTRSLGRTDQLLFLRKPFDPSEVSLLAASLTTKWNLARQARLRLAELEELTSTRTATLRQEVNDRRAAEERLRHLALHDSLTGLPNRASLLERLRLCNERRTRETGYRFAVLFMDLDNFKLVNDSLGHDIGDELLVGAAERLRSVVRALDAVSHGPHEAAARLGGDEFVVLLDGLARPEDAVVVAERIQQRLSEPMMLRGHEVSVSASIGITVVDRTYDRAEDILRDADAALYRAKGQGKARFAMFDEQLHAQAVARLRLETDLRRALQDGQFWVAYEPIVAADTAAPTGFEALLRWNHPERGPISPGEFIPIAEDTGLIVPIGHWVLDTALAQLRAWTDRFPHLASLSVNVNLSKRQLLESNLPGAIARLLQEHNLDGRRLNLEVTESTIMARMDLAAKVLHRVRELGVGIHLDDFGTGLSSLASLHQLPIDTLKVDRSFIMNMTDKPKFAALVLAMLTLAQNLNIQVIAEGVESGEQLAQLLSLGCNYVQGFHISRSLSAEQATRMLESGLQWSKAA
jgi:diguanylate cyclase (GGDEF)-like protein